jgi:glycosyltransferase involved in cell wall biosynthesis
VITNSVGRDFDVIEITNEMPHNRIGGVGSIVEALMSGFDAIGVRALWYVTDHGYQPYEVDAILASHGDIAFGNHAELAAYRAPVAHVHSYNHAPDLLGALDGTRSLFTIHSLLAQEEISNDIDLRSAVAGQERLISTCDEVALVSEAERVYYDRFGYGRLNDRVSVIHNGIAPPRLRAPRTQRNVIGYCGRLVPRKHPEYAQMLLCEPGFENFETMIAGKAFSRYARDLVHDLRIEDRVHYLGWCGGARLEAFYDAIDVLVQPSTYEPFGLAALEAAARGIPLVCTRIDGLVEVLGESAIYCEDPGYAAFRDAMRRWLGADPAALAEMTGRARERALTHFTDIAMAQRYRDRFNALAADERPPGPAHPDRHVDTRRTQR